MTPMRHRVGIAILVIFLLIPAMAFAQRDVLPKNIHHFTPTVDHSGMIVTYGTDYLGTLRFAYELYGDVAISPLEYKNPNNDQRMTLIQQQAAAQLMFAFGLSDYINIGYAFPYVFMRSFEEDYKDYFEGNDEPQNGGIVDNRVDIKVLGLQRTRYCMGLGLVTSITIPFYQKNNFLSDDGTTVAPRLIFDIGREKVIWALNLGYKYYTRTASEDEQVMLLEDAEVDDELLINTGLRVRFPYEQELLIDSAVKTLVSAPFGNAEADYVEIMAAYRKRWIRLHYNDLTFGASAGLTRGVGTPFVRLFIGFGRDEARLHYAVENR